MDKADGWRSRLMEGGRQELEEIKTGLRGQGMRDREVHGRREEGNYQNRFVRKKPLGT